MPATMRRQRIACFPASERKRKQQRILSARCHQQAVEHLIEESLIWINSRKKDFLETTR
jgi:hypothetical protein